ncbi:TRAP transporter large permease subunit [Arthrobacter cupressi]|uniref:TRAP-type C4-dicarboxylate transport system, large permease component n=1 Tax=Arthrobacter cupressi TaxID=1045773 RepID=A0A1G8SHM7_9MICC|nr:TRAP transporter large permease subunit [Arthrobacter cupressi]NYD78500.1 TRAP-type C4-dicarboxylate transport system permease large subunit [Arthrobacter cupressi]SDJ28736.1 TRAP-type C4-dicarboxylate transport system, large permease component [Arthrobacter cupressi]
MIGIWALGAYLAVILLWTTLLKRSVGEAMILGFLVVLPFTGAAAAQVGWEALYTAATDEIVYATMAFVFMGYLLDKAGVLDKLIDLLNSLIGGVKGGPAWVSTVASAGLGGVVHNQAAIAATVGSVTIPWMEKSKLDKASAATLVAGNAGMGITFPFSASMFVLVGSATVGPLLNVNELVLPLLVGGLWCFLHRLIVTWLLVRRSGMAPLDSSHRLAVRTAFGQGWATLLLFVVVAVPLILTSGAIATALSDWTGGDITKTVSIIVWIPVVLIITGALLGWKLLPRGARVWRALLQDSAPRFGVVGITVLFAFAGANALAATGLPKQMTALLTQLNLPLWLLAILIGLIVIAVAAPLSATATMAAVGTVGVATLVAAGVPATTAAVAVLVFSSCEAAVPPGGAPLYVACGIADVNPITTFARLITHYALPLLGIGVLIILGVLPI